MRGLPNAEIVMACHASNNPNLCLLITLGVQVDIRTNIWPDVRKGLRNCFLDYKSSVSSGAPDWLVTERDDQFVALRNAALGTYDAQTYLFSLGLANNPALDDRDYEDDYNGD